MSGSEPWHYTNCMYEGKASLKHTAPACAHIIAMIRTTNTVLPAEATTRSKWPEPRRDVLINRVRKQEAYNNISRHLDRRPEELCFCLGRPISP
eukprot:1674150-Heterocapsa_arctica.AAC.1